jgi:hypothetical protein
MKLTFWILPFILLITPFLTEGKEKNNKRTKPYELRVYFPCYTKDLKNDSLCALKYSFIFGKHKVNSNAEGVIKLSEKEYEQFKNQHFTIEIKDLDPLYYESKVLKIIDANGISTSIDLTSYTLEKFFKRLKDFKAPKIIFETKQNAWYQVKRPKVVG